MFVYLAGTITGLSQKKATGWRDRAAQFLEPHGITCLDPCRGKNFAPGVRYDSREIVSRDKQDIRRSRVMLTCLEGASTGTDMEIMYAHMNEIPVILVTRNDALKVHYWIEAHVTRVFEELDDALEYIVEYWK